MQAIYTEAIRELRARIKQCRREVNQPNSMVDQGWSDARHTAYWMMQQYEATYKLEAINQRIATRKAA